MDTAKVIQRLFWGVDFRILNQCVDEKVRFIRNEIIILILSTLSAYFLTTIIGVVVFATYKMYLSNLHLTLTGKNNKFIQWFVATLFALGNAYCFLTANVSLDQYMVIGIVVVASLILFYFPVRFTEEENGQYAKLLKKTLSEENKWAEIAIDDSLQKETQRRNNQANLDKKVEQLSSDMIAQEIANARTRVAKEALAKWEEQQKKYIQTDIDKYIHPL